MQEPTLSMCIVSEERLGSCSDQSSRKLVELTIDAKTTAHGWRTFQQLLHSLNSRANPRACQTDLSDIALQSRARLTEKLYTRRQRTSPMGDKQSTTPILS